MFFVREWFCAIFIIKVIYRIINLFKVCVLKNFNMELYSMNLEIVDLNNEQIEDIESRLNDYDEKYISYRISGSIHIGITDNGILIAGADACITAFKILYVSTVFVDKAYRGKGIGKKLMEELEKRAANLGANTIRLDTFDWQGFNFYKKLGYEQAGSYTNDVDGFSEYFFVKRI